MAATILNTFCVIYINKRRTVSHAVDQKTYVVTTMLILYEEERDMRENKCDRNCFECKFSDCILTDSEARAGIKIPNERCSNDDGVFVSCITGQSTNIRKEKVRRWK